MQFKLNKKKCHYKGAMKNWQSSREPLRMGSETHMKSLKKKKKGYVSIVEKQSHLSFGEVNLRCVDGPSSYEVLLGVDRVNLPLSALVSQ